MLRIASVEMTINLFCKIILIQKLLILQGLSYEFLRKYRIIEPRIAIEGDLQQLAA